MQDWASFATGQFVRDVLKHIQKSEACAEAWMASDDKGELKGKGCLQHQRVMTKYLNSAGEGEPLNWAQCETCDKWRDVSDVIIGAFECAMVGRRGGNIVSFDTAEDKDTQTAD